MVRTGFLKRQTSRCSVNMKTVFKRLLSRCSVNNEFKKTIQFFQESTYVGVSLLVKLTVWLPTFTFIFTSYSFRSSDWQIIFKVAILKTLAKLTGKHMWWSPFSTIKGLHQRFFPVNFGKFFIFFAEYIRANGFVLLRLFSILKAVTVLFLFAYPKQ